MGERLGPARGAQSTDLLGAAFLVTPCMTPADGQAESGRLTQSPIRSVRGPDAPRTPSQVAICRCLPDPLGPWGAGHLDAWPDREALDN